MKKLLLLLIMAVLVGCTVTKYVPVEHTEYVTVRDSVYFRDTTIRYQIEKERYTEYAGLLDTLRLSTDYASAEAYIDTTANLLKGTIESKPDKEVIIKWKEKIITRDSLVYEEKPVPYEVEKIVKKVPWWAKFLSSIGALSLIAATLYILRKFHIL